MPMRWINEPPVSEVSAEEFEEYAKAYIRDLESWKAPKVGKKDKELQHFNDDIDYRIDEANVYKARGKDIRWAVYKLATGPAALMRMRVTKDSVKIEDLTSHVGGTGGGVIMIEWAVNYSETKEKKGGRLTLFDAAKTSSNAGTSYYAKVFGFESVDGQLMSLDPNEKPEFWERLGGRWKLKKYTQLFLEDGPGEAPKAAGAEPG